MPSDPRRVEKNCPFFTFPSVTDRESGLNPKGASTVNVSVTDSATESSEAVFPLPHDVALNATAAKAAPNITLFQNMVAKLQQSLLSKWGGGTDMLKELWKKM